MMHVHEKLLGRGMNKSMKKEQVRVYILGCLVCW